MTLIINIIITSFGALASIVTIFCVFFQVKNPIKISRRDVGFIFLWLTLMILGIINLCNSNNITEGTKKEISDTVNEQNHKAQKADIKKENDNFYEEKLFIEQNFDLIQELKAEYSDENINEIKSNTANIMFNERACNMFPSLKNTEMNYKHEGIGIIPTKVIILDFITDEIIYVYNPQEYVITHSPGDKNVFYCVVFHDNYELYVTPPMRVVGGENNYLNQYYLSAKNDEYTPLFQICLYIQDLKLDDSINFDDYNVLVECSDFASGRVCSKWRADISESGILSLNEYSYFSLNTNYEIIISLYRKTDDDGDGELIGKSTCNGSNENSNLVNIFFIIEDENEE